MNYFKLPLLPEWVFKGFSLKSNYEFVWRSEFTRVSCKFILLDSEIVLSLKIKAC